MKGIAFTKYRVLCKRNVTDIRELFIEMVMHVFDVPRPLIHFCLAPSKRNTIDNLINLINSMMRISPCFRLYLLNLLTLLLFLHWQRLNSWPSPLGRIIDIIVIIATLPILINSRLIHLISIHLIQINDKNNIISETCQAM